MIKDINNRFTEIQDVDKKAPASSKVIERLILRNLVLTTKDLKDWRTAREEAKHVENPSREKLIKIWDEIDNDGHVSGITEAIKNTCKAKDFELIDENGDIDEDATKLLRKKWFFKFIDYVVESRFFGYTLVQLGGIVDDGFPNIAKVPREFVVPEQEIVRFNLRQSFRSKGEKPDFRYTDRKNADWFVMIGDEKLGLFNKAAPHAIAKRTLFAAMWEFSELFGIPIRKGKTDIKDPERKKNMMEMLQKMGAKAWMVLDKDDEVDIIDSATARGGSASGVFTDPIKTSNEEISKAFSGGTGMFDEKAFVGSAEVQERTFWEFISSYFREIEFVVNDDLMPRLVTHGIFPEGLRIRYPQKQMRTPKEQAEMIATLSPFFVFHPDTVTEQIGITVEAEAPNESPNPSGVTSVMPAVAELYKDIFKSP